MRTSSKPHRRKGAPWCLRTSQITARSPLRAFSASAATPGLSTLRITTFGRTLSGHDAVWRRDRLQCRGRASAQLGNLSGQQVGGGMPRRRRVGGVGAKPFDVAAKQLLELDPAGWLRFLGVELLRLRYPQD